MHSSVSRLLDYAKRHTASSAQPVSSYPALQVRLQISSASLTNWKQRGVSKEGAIKAEKEFGCSVNWVLTGEGPEDASSTSGVAPSGAPKGVPSLDDSLAVLGAALVNADDLTKIQVASLLDTWIRHPERNDEIGRRIIGLLREPSLRLNPVKEKQ